MASGGPLPTLIAALQEREQRRAALQREMEGIDHRQQVVEIDEGQLGDALEQHLRLHWHNLLKKHGMQARQLLRKLLPERQRLRFTPGMKGERSGMCSQVVQPVIGSWQVP